MKKYAGQAMETGDQAKAFADHFIKVHLGEVAGGQTYSQISAKAQADPSNQQLAGQVQTLFRGETLRGLLLNAYAFDTMARVVLIAAVGLAGGGSRPDRAGRPRSAALPADDRDHVGAAGRSDERRAGLRQAFPGSCAPSREPAGSGEPGPS